MIFLVLGYDEEEHDLVVERLEEKQIRTVIPSLAGQLLIKATYYTCDFRRAGSRSSFEAVNRFGYFGRGRLIEPITDWLDKLTRFPSSWVEGARHKKLCGDDARDL